MRLRKLWPRSTSTASEHVTGLRINPNSDGTMATGFTVSQEYLFAISEVHGRLSFELVSLRDIQYDSCLLSDSHFVISNFMTKLSSQWMAGDLLGMNRKIS